MFKVRRQPLWPDWQDRFWLVEVYHDNGEHAGISYYVPRKTPAKLPPSPPTTTSADFDPII